MLIQHTQAILDYLKDHTEKDIFPRYEDRQAWHQGPQALQDRIIMNADQFIGYEWPQLKASDYLDFYSSGVHVSPYHKRFMKRRNLLGQLLMAECIEGQGRFMKDIINGVFCICEESTWVVPQHNAILNKEEVIDPKTPFRRTGHIDLFAAETAALLTWCNYFLRDAFDALSPNISRRIDEELMVRIIKPYLASDDFHWMGFSPASSARGNWTPWVNCNCMVTFLYGCSDRALKLEGIEKVIRSVQLYLDYIGDSGGCNEGPVYWTVAAGMAFDLIDLLYRATDQSLPLFESDKFKNMGKYIYRLYIGDHQYVNFADAPCKDPGTKDGGLLYRYGLASGDDQLMALGKAVFQRNIDLLADRETFQLSLTNNSYRTVWNFWNLFNYKTLMEGQPQVPYIKDAYIDDVQVMVAREDQGNKEGFFICAKGGSNKESHNHNDVGHFVLYHHKQPVCIDPGALPYSLDYFGDNRYTYWVTRSDHHNLPVINGQAQRPGEAARAKKLFYQAQDHLVTYRMNIEDSYPVEAKVTSWQRTYQFHRSGIASIVIEDQYELEETDQALEWVFMSPREVSLVSDSRVILASYKGSGPIVLELDQACFQIKVEAIDLRETPKLMADWGETLYRISLVNKAMATTGIRTFTFKVVD